MRDSLLSKSKKENLKRDGDRSLSVSKLSMIIVPTNCQR
jgi:hypothetical protein